MASNSSIFAEAASALRGVGMLVIGDRRAPACFDLTPRGLAGSFIALLLITAINATMPTLLGVTGPAASIFRGAAMVAILFTFQLAFAALVLRQLKRLDGLLPYLVADNWATFYVTIITSALAMSGLAGDFMLIFVAILVIVVQINVARLVVTLAPMQIALFIVAQLIGVTIGLMFTSTLFPMSPAELQQLGVTP